MHFWMIKVCLLFFMEVVVHVNTSSINLPTPGNTATRALGISSLKISTTISTTGVSSCWWIYEGEFSSDTFYSNAFGCSNYTGVNETISCVTNAGTVTSQLTLLQPQYKDLNINMQCSPSPSYSVNIVLKECNDTYQGLTPSNNANYMGTATFKCIGANQISLVGTCQPNVTWSISGSCPAVQCNTTAATDSANGIILTNSALLNTLVNVSDTVSVGCGDGFNGTGGSRTCQADGTWSASITCARVCNTSAVVSNGICLSSSVTRNSNVAVGSVVSLTCCVGYIPNNGSGTCANDGSWNTAVICTLIPTTPGPTTQTPTAPSDTTPIFTNNTSGTSQPTTTTKNTECSWCLWLLWLLLLPICGGAGLLVWKMGYCEKQ